MEYARKKISQITGFGGVEITNRGNQSIFSALEIVNQINNKKQILIPDQGGWISFKLYPKYFGFSVKELKTEDGIINTEELYRNIKDSSALLLTSFAGYFAEQNISEIYEICNKNNVLLIEDATGAIGDDFLCRHNHADIIVGSFSNYNPVDVGYGGFIATSQDLLKNARFALSLSNPHPNAENEILNKLNSNKLKKMLNFSDFVKEELKSSGFRVIHGDKRGINVMCEYNPFLLDYCEEKEYPYMICPNYNRLNRKAISIELKRLE